VYRNLRSKIPSTKTHPLSIQGKPIESQNMSFGISGLNLFVVLAKACTHSIKIRFGRLQKCGRQKNIDIP
jgi:hypothetical protein